MVEKDFRNGRTCSEFNAFKTVTVSLFGLNAGFAFRKERKGPVGRFGEEALGEKGDGSRRHSLACEPRIVHSKNLAHSHSYRAS